MKTSIETQMAFTRVDLVAIVSVVVVLGMLAVPLRGDAQSESDTIICQTNKRQLVRATHLYTMDNGGLLPLNGNSDATAPGRNWVIYTVDLPPGATNTSALSNPSTSLLANYLERNARPFRCPADRTGVRIAGQIVPRARSVSMNNAVGTDPLQPKNPTPGFWLSGDFSHTANRTFRCFGKLSDMVRPRPSDVFIFLDEHPDSINDGMFGSMGPLPQSQMRWIDVPASYHGGGAGFGMGDGSALIHQWRVPMAITGQFNPPPVSTSYPDLLWLANITTARVTDQP